MELRICSKIIFKIIHATAVESKAEHVYVLENVHLYHSATVIQTRNCQVFKMRPPIEQF